MSQQLTDKEKREIEQASVKYSPDDIIPQIDYAEGATAERLKAKVLLEALEDIKNMETSGSRFDILRIVTDALSSYNNK